MDDLVTDFLAESRVELDRACDALARLRQGAPARPCLEEMLRGARYARTGAGAIGLVRISTLAGALEDHVTRLRGGEPMRPDTAHTLERALDRMRRLIAMVAATGAEPAGGDPDLEAALGEEGERRAALGPTREDPAPQHEADEVWAEIERGALLVAAQMRKAVQIGIDETARALPHSLVRALKRAIMLFMRHACVYSIEPEALRVSRGKRATAMLRITAMLVGREAVLAIGDDGQGLPLDRMRRRAELLNLLPKARAANLSDADAAALIFERALSTFGEGDGAHGLDLARHDVEALGGAVDVNTLHERGVTFIIRAPLHGGPLTKPRSGPRTAGAFP